MGFLENLPLSRKFKSYVGISGARRKLLAFLRDFKFTDIDGADRAIDWENARVITV